MTRMVVRIRGPVKRQLRKLRQKTTDKGLANRCQIVLLWGEGQGWFEIARGVGCSISWVGRVIRRFRDHGIAGLEDRREDNGQTKLDEQYLATLYQIVDRQPPDFGYPRPTWTVELLAKVMEQQTGVKVHPGTMSRALKLIGSRLGRPRPTVGCPWSKAAKGRRLAAIRRAVEGRAADEVAVYLDEVDIHLNPKIGPDWLRRELRRTDEPRHAEAGPHARPEQKALRVRGPGRGKRLHRICGRRAEEQPAVYRHARVAVEKVSSCVGDPRRAGQLQNPRQQAGGGVDEAERRANRAALSAAVLSGPQQDRAQVAGPARGGHA